MIGRPARLTDRPLRARERQGLFALATAVIVCAAALLLTLPPDPEPPSPAGAALSVAAPPVYGAASARRQDERGQAEVTARRFLNGYLRFLYGRGPGTAIKSTTRDLHRRLVRGRLRVPPAARRRHPRVIDLDAQRVRRGRFVATAEIGDGGPARYPIELTVTRRHGRWRVSEVADH